MEHASRSMADRAAERLPPEHRERYREEWRGELQSLEGRPLSMFAHALGCAASARKLSRELAPALQPERGTYGWRKLIRDRDRVSSTRRREGVWPAVPRRISASNRRVLRILRHKPVLLVIYLATVTFITTMVGIATGLWSMQVGAVIVSIAGLAALIAFTLRRGF
jgi:hypothetical protein